MNKSTIDLRLLALALSICVLGACSAPDTDSAAAPAATAGGGPDSAQQAPGPGIDQAAAVPSAAPTGPVDPMTRQLVTMAAGLFAAERACLPDRAASVSEARATNRKAVAATSTSMSAAQVDALFDSAYADAERKMQALSAAERQSACAELEAAAKASAAAASR